MIIDYHKFLWSDINWNNCKQNITFSSHASVNWKYQRFERSLVDLKHRLVSQCLFLMFIHCMALLPMQAFGSSSTLISENAWWPLFQNPRAVMSSLVSFDQFIVLPCSSSPYKVLYLCIFANFWYYSCSEITYVVMSDAHKTTFLTAHAVLNVEFTSTWTKNWKIFSFPTITKRNWISELLLW